jgi:glucosamine--fructose-6-phosphate aminotransferase (isomerizing)
MCGIIGLLSKQEPQPLTSEERLVMRQEALALERALEQNDPQIMMEQMQCLALKIESLPSSATAFTLGHDPSLREDIERVKTSLNLALEAVARGQKASSGFRELDQWNALGLLCRDLLWRLERDLLATQEELYRLYQPPWSVQQRIKLAAYWEIEFILRGLQRLEIRGRDSSGISIITHFPSADAYRDFVQSIKHADMFDQWQRRRNANGLGTGAICGDPKSTQADIAHSLSFVYKVASEVGSIGQNIANLREQYQGDPLLKMALDIPNIKINALAHTRWASNGIINIFNAHPQGNDVQGMTAAQTKLFAVLNGDIDNFKELVQEFCATTGQALPVGVTTDAKIIPLLVEAKYRECGDLREAFRLTLRKFQGSFAIALHHLDHPDRVWLGIGGSGQSLYVGIHEQMVFYASELYGIVEGSTQFVKLDGERERETGNPSTRGQLLELDRTCIGQARPFRAWGFDGVSLSDQYLPIKHAQITTRDINIADYPHFFIKEITESVESVRKTLHGRFFLHKDPAHPFSFNLDDSTVPRKVIDGLKHNAITKIFCIGQGTAAVAAMGVARALQRNLGSRFVITSTRATELSGHLLSENMEDTLVIAVSQSGTTTDTNRTVDLVRHRGAQVVSILNRRNSDLAFKSDGVIYTSDGRDVEMSVASTKAFYSQLTAGFLLSLYLGYQTGILDTHRVHDGLNELRLLPGLMARTLSLSNKIRDIAWKYAPSRRYWAVVGSGYNQIAAQEIRIKLSELCYKSISCDTTEDKKHIDLSAEPLMLVCAAALDDTNLGDIIKEVAIFKAHRSLPIVIANNGAKRFEPYATAVVELPDISPHLSPILTTIVGHLFGYYAACAIEQQALALRKIRSSLLNWLSMPQTNIDDTLVIDLQEALREMFDSLQTPQYNSALEVNTAVRLVFNAQRLLHSLIEHDNMSIADIYSPYDIGQQLLESITEAIRELSRPIDAIKHQAKTVTVGISRPVPSLRGHLGAIFRELQIDQSSLIWRHISYLIAADPLISEVSGATIYSISNLDPDGIPTSDSKIYRELSHGLAAEISSRTETDHLLKGSKWLALKENSVYIGTGRRDGRNIAIIPIRCDNPNQARILLLHLSFNEQASLQDRLNLLRSRGYIYDQFRAATTEINLSWSDQLLLDTPVEYLFDDSPDRFISSLSRLAFASAPSYPELPEI